MRFYLFSTRIGISEVIPRMGALLRPYDMDETVSARELRSKNGFTPRLNVNAESFARHLKQAQNNGDTN